jgi:nitrogen regulatory protein PII
MKEVKAYIKPHKLDAVILALFHIEDLPGFSVVDVRGCGQQHVGQGERRQVEDLVKHAKIEVVCRDEQVEEIIAAIERAAHTGLRGDGKIYVCTIEQAVSIHTGERGKSIV